MNYENDNINDDSLQLDNLKQANIYVRVRMMMFFVLFVAVVIAIVKNGYSLDFFSAKASQFEPICSEINRQKPTDDDELRMEKVTTLLAVNEEKFQQLAGFVQAQVVLEPIGYKGRKLPVVQIEFNQVENDGVKLPETICGFDVKAVYK